MITHRILIACVALFCAMHNDDSKAATRDLRLTMNATGACQAALPQYDTTLRKRPTGMFNEGNASVFVTCSPMSLQNVPITVGHGITIYNTNAHDVVVNCTGVTSDAPAPAFYMPKSSTFGQNEAHGIAWVASDGLNGSFTTFNISCLLPPGVGITTLFINQTLDVGN